MRTTLDIDDDLLAKAAALTGLLDVSFVVREALRALVQRESDQQPSWSGTPDLKDSAPVLPEDNRWMHSS